MIELIGGIEPARTYILAALKAGKNVVTANKDLIAVHGKEILETARAAQKDFLFEAAVAGGIPIFSIVFSMISLLLTCSCSAKCVRKAPEKAAFLHFWSYYTSILMIFQGYFHLHCILSCF